MKRKKKQFWKNIEWFKEFNKNMRYLKNSIKDFDKDIERIKKIAESAKKLGKS